jgi:hypothetical protein
MSWCFSTTGESSAGPSAQKFSLHLLPFRLPKIEMRVASLEVMQTASAPNHSPAYFARAPGAIGSFGDKLNCTTTTTWNTQFCAATGRHRSRNPLQDNQIDGLVMDTTFRVIRQSYAPMLVSMPEFRWGFCLRKTIEVSDSFY